MTMDSNRFMMRYTMSAEGQNAEVMVYSEIADSKWWGEESTPKDFDKELKEARKNGAENLTIRVNSPGGEVFSAVAMRTMVMMSDFKSVNVRIEGLCASAATVFACIPGAKVSISEGSQFMIHNPSTIVYGNADDMEHVAEELRKIEGDFHAMYSKRTGKPVSEIKEMMDYVTWMTADETVENGFADEVLKGETIAASATRGERKLMEELYGCVPESVKYADDDVKVPVSSISIPISFGDRIDSIIDTSALLISDHTEAGNKIQINMGSIGTEGVAPEDPSVNTKKQEETEIMEIKDITMEQLRAENRAVFDEVFSAGATAERERISDIDELTLPGYEAMAAEAKANGTSAMDYHKAIVKAQKEKGANYIAARVEETAPAAEVSGEAVEDETKTDDEQDAKEIAEFARTMRADNASMY